MDLLLKRHFLHEVLFFKFFKFYPRDIDFRCFNSSSSSSNSSSSSSISISNSRYQLHDDGISVLILISN